MKFSQPLADIHVPDGCASDEALARTTHLCVAAHQDDIEIMAYHGIAECYDRKDRWFTGVVVTDGAGSPRCGRYEIVSDQQMQEIRRGEQRRASDIGRYGLQLQLVHPSAAVKVPGSPEVSDDLRFIFENCRPSVVYLHNPFDKHDTHVAVLERCLDVIRAMPEVRRPPRVIGCEVWRDLDWLPDAEKIAMDVSAHPSVALDLLRVFDSQIAGGKRYDLATMGRRTAHATFHTSHATDAFSAVTFGVDLTPLVRDVGLGTAAFIESKLNLFREDVLARLKRLS